MKRFEDTTLHTDAAGDSHLLWLAIGVVGVVFFFVAHNVHVSQYEGFAPWSDMEGSLESGGNVVKGLALSVIGLLGTYLLFRRDGRPFNLHGWLPTLMIGYLGWSVASVLWSIDPGMSCRRLAVLMFCVLGAAGFARQFKPRDIVLMAMVVSGVYLLVGVGAELVLGTFRPWSSGYRFAGTVHPNTQGANAAVFCIASLCLSRSATRQKAWLWTLFAVGLALLLLTKSRTACAGLAIGLAALWMLGVTGRMQILAILGVVFVVCAMVLMSTLFDVDAGDDIAEAAMLGRQTDVGTLTGRIPIWTELLRYLAARPLQGYGYGAFWTDQHIEAISTEMQWPLREAHCAYVDAPLSVGLIGAAVFLAAVLLSLRHTATTFCETGDPGFAFTFCILVLGMVSACLETGMMDPSFFTLMAGSGVMQLLTLR